MILVIEVLFVPMISCPTKCSVNCNEVDTTLQSVLQAMTPVKKSNCQLKYCQSTQSVMCNVKLVVIKQSK